ncbi:hypothetical protein [Lysobacter panacisoli]|uniref:Uncharacterized protein n=1 Tax=Lysobacter panacisoli TaxID=1255263 RepID=A0ABP9LIR2_9GAMM|nr:hypothetical protein [Lysobacter panacisoli]
MSQNLISLTISAEQWDAIDVCLGALETHLAPLIAMPADQRRQLAKMGDKSEAFCRQAMDVLNANPGVIPPNFDLAALREDLKALDQLRPRLVRLARLHERATDTETALGSDIMSGALEGYALLKVAGKGEGLEGLRKALSARFSRSTRQAETKPTM